MTVDKHHLTLFASTVGAGLGAATLAAGVGHGDFDALMPTWFGGHLSAMTVGGTILVLSVLAFIVTVGNGVRSDGPLRARTAFLAMAMGVASLWFWLVPGRTAYIAIACQQDNMSACAIAHRMGGGARMVAEANDAWVERKCVAGDPEFCRTAAARRLIHPTKFCGKIPIGAEFEVVEWCTRSQQRRTLVPRR